MSAGRVVSACLASALVAGGVTVTLGMVRAGREPAPPVPTAVALATRSTRPVSLPMSRAAGATAARRPATPSATSAAPSRLPTTHAVPPTPTASATPSPRPSPTLQPPTTTHARVPAVHHASATPRPTTSHRAPAPTPAVRGHALPLRFRTGKATRVITVTARSKTSTTARLQAWTKASGGGWLKHGTAMTAHVGSDGLTTHPSESRSATPIGSFTLTRAFGRYPNPGTGLHYFRTGPSDWWISQLGKLYNTHQRCAKDCPFRRGSPNEHLYYEMPYYRYAVVIDYNTRNAPGGVVQGAGSAFFLHVTDGHPTAGCVAIAQARLVPLMRWLTPKARPRILIGVP